MLWTPPKQATLALMIVNREVTSIFHTGDHTRILRSLPEGS